MTMRALQWNATTKVLSLVDLDIPALPSQQHVLVKVAYCGVSKMETEIIWTGQMEFPREKTILGYSVSGKNAIADMRKRNMMTGRREQDKQL